MDVLCQAKSGMGKTAVFVLATLQELDIDEAKSSDDVLVLVLAHTRELAYQIQNEYRRFAKYLPGIRTAVFFGGEPYAKNLETLKTVKPQVVVLAISDSREDLEAEVAELNETWNHWDLRSERHRYEIQSVCLLQTGRDPIRRAAASSGPHEVSGT